MLPSQERALLHPDAASAFGLGEPRARADRLYLRLGQLSLVRFAKPFAAGMRQRFLQAPSRCW